MDYYIKKAIKECSEIIISENEYNEEYQNGVNEILQLLLQAQKLLNLIK